MKCHFPKALCKWPLDKCMECFRWQVSFSDILVSSQRCGRIPWHGILIIFFHFEPFLLRSLLSGLPASNFFRPFRLLAMSKKIILTWLQKRSTLPKSARAANTWSWAFQEHSPQPAPRLTCLATWPKPRNSRPREWGRFSAFLSTTPSLWPLGGRTRGLREKSECWQTLAENSPRYAQ